MSTPPTNLPFEPAASAPPTPLPPPAPPTASSAFSPPPTPPVPPPIPPRPTPPPVPPVMPPPMPSTAVPPPPVPKAPPAMPQINTMPLSAELSAPRGKEPEDMFSGVAEPSAPMPPKTAGAMAPLPEQHASIGKFIVIGLGVLVLLALVGFGFWYFAIRSLKSTTTMMTPTVPAVSSSTDDGSPVMNGSVATDTGTMEPTTSVDGSQSATTTIPEPVTTPPAGVNIPLPTTSDTSQGSSLATTTVTSGNMSTTTMSATTTAAVDTDGDGLSDQRELELGTNPKVADTDGDGVSDGDEVLKYGTNPLNPDTDGDGYPDGAEISKGYNPLGPGKCATPDCVR